MSGSRVDRAELLVCALLLLLVGLLWVGASYMEARAFNRATGSNMTTVDALFTKLRVEGVAK